MVNAPSAYFFLGSNAPTGFYSLYDHLIDPIEAEDFLILKGGPGCGKSSLIKRVGKTLSDHGLTIEYIQCSGDPGSLDAILIPALKAAVVDGTAPHVVEPKYPGVAERYVNLCSCYDSAALKKLRAEIMFYTDASRSCYPRAYQFLNAACQVSADIQQLFRSASLQERILKRTRGIAAREIKKRNHHKPGHVVKRFLGGVTYKGVICRYDTAELLCHRIYELVDSYGLADPMLSALLDYAVTAGYDVIACPSPLQPNRLEHLLVPALSLGFVSVSPASPRNGQSYRRIRLDSMIDHELIRRNRTRLRFSRKLSATLLNEAVSFLGQAKALHDELEALYNPHVDFSTVYETADAIAADFLKKWDAIKKESSE